MGCTQSKDQLTKTSKTPTVDHEKKKIIMKMDTIEVKSSVNPTMDMETQFQPSPSPPQNVLIDDKTSQFVTDAKYMMPRRASFLLSTQKEEEEEVATSGGNRDDQGSYYNNNVGPLGNKAFQETIMKRASMDTSYSTYSPDEARRRRKEPIVSTGSIARRILEEDVENDNDGSLSPSNGFLPFKAPMTSFKSNDERVKAWDDLVTRMRGHIHLSPSEFRKQVDEIQCLPVHILSKDELLRAATVMGSILNLYYWTGANFQLPRQDLMDAWGNIRKRLGWYVEDEDGGLHWGPFFGLEYSLYNWMQPNISGQYDPNDLNLDDMLLLVPQIPDDVTDLRNFYCPMVLMLAKGASLPLLCVEAQEAAANADDDLLADSLISIAECWEGIREAFALINPHHGSSNNKVRPALFPMFADYSVSMPATKVAPNGKKIINPATGQAYPIFQLMDYFFNRKVYTGKIGKDVEVTRRLHPRRWNQFLSAIQHPDSKNTMCVETYIIRSENTELMGLYLRALQNYAGPKGFFGYHTVKMYGYISMLFRTGRNVTNAGTGPSHPLDRIEDIICNELMTTQRDRLQNRPGEELCHMATIHGKPTPVGSEESNMYSVVLDVRGQGVLCSSGDHFEIIPMNLPDVADTFRSHIMDILDIKLDDEVKSAFSSSWNETLLSIYGNDTSQNPRLLDISLFGDISEFFKADTRDKGINLENLQKIPPLTPRQYSISVIQTNQKGIAEFLYLKVHYWPDGVASVRLIQSEPGTKIMFRIQPSHSLHSQHMCPTIYFASGTGLSPFTYRYSDNTFPHKQWLIWMTREISDDMRADFKFVCKYNQRLSIDVIQTKLSTCQYDTDSILHNYNVHYTDATRNQRLVSLTKNNEVISEKLIQWLGGDVMIYICGNVGFVIEVVNFLIDKGVMIDDMVSSGKLRVECFGSPGWTPSNQKLITPWQVLRSSIPYASDHDSPLMVIGNSVFELTKTILDLHPGGKDIILMYQGSDATKSFELVGHNKDGNALGMLKAVEVGIFDSSLFSSIKMSGCDLIRIGFDCAEIRNGYLLEESALLDLDSVFYQSELNQANALKTHRRVLLLHLPRLRDMVQSVCHHFFPHAKWSVALDKVEVMETFKDMAAFEVLQDWESVLLDDRKFLTSNVLAAAQLTEAMASKSNENEIPVILESWRKVIVSFWKESGFQIWQQLRSTERAFENNENSDDDQNNEVVNALTNEQMDDCKETFAAFTDQEGYVDISKLCVIMGALGEKISSEELHALIKEYKAESRNKIDFYQFMNIITPRLMKRNKVFNVKELFKEFDIDGDGYISATELRLSLKKLGSNFAAIADDLTDEDVEEIMIEADLDGDGRISYSEFAIMIPKLNQILEI